MNFPTTISIYNIVRNGMTPHGEESKERSDLCFVQTKHENNIVFIII